MSYLHALPVDHLARDHLEVVLLCRCGLRTYPPSSPTTTGPAGCAAGGPAISMGCCLTTSWPTRSALLRTVPAFCAPLIGNSSDRRVATLPKETIAAYRAVT